MTLAVSQDHSIEVLREKETVRSIVRNINSAIQHGLIAQQELFLEACAITGRDDTLPKELKTVIAEETPLTESQVENMFHCGKGLYMMNLSADTKVSATVVKILAAAGPTIREEFASKINAGETPSVKEVKGKVNEYENKKEVIETRIETYKERLEKCNDPNHVSTEGRGIKGEIGHLKEKIKTNEKLLEELKAEQESPEEIPYVDPAIAKILTKKDLDIKAKDKELEALKKTIKDAEEEEKDEWIVEEHLNTVLHKVLPDSARCLDLKQQVELATKQFDGLVKQAKDAQDIKKVTPENLEHRVEVVNSTGARWHELAITYAQAKKVCTDEDMIACAEDGIYKSWKAWIENLPLNTVVDLLELAKSRLPKDQDVIDV